MIGLFVVLNKSLKTHKTDGCTLNKTEPLQRT